MFLTAQALIKSEKAAQCSYFVTTICLGPDKASCER
jgi:hypothetical protein